MRATNVSKIVWIILVKSLILDPLSKRLGKPFSRTASSIITVIIFASVVMSEFSISFTEVRQQVRVSTLMTTVSIIKLQTITFSAQR
jgi:hypothetical protein